MSWQTSIRAAAKALRREEAGLQKQIDVIRNKITELEDMGKSGGGSGPTRKRSTRRLSSKGRAAISRAAKRRWAEYRRQKKS